MPSSVNTKQSKYVKYRGPILHVTSLALGSDDLNFDQSATSIQIFPEPNAGHETRFFFYKITTLIGVDVKYQSQNLLAFEQSCFSYVN